MSKRISDLTHSLRQLGEIEVTDWDFAELLNREIELGSALRRLGSIKVNDWDFGEVMPKIHRLAHKEVELPEFVRRAADFKVMEWDFRSSSSGPKPLESQGDDPAPDELPQLIARLRAFLQFVVSGLVEQTECVQIRVEELRPTVVRFHVVVAQSDVKDLIGRQGATASAMRNLLKARALSWQINALLEIRSHEEELTGSQRGIDRK